MMVIRKDFATRRFWSAYAIHSFAAFGAIALLLDLSSLAYPSAGGFGGWRLLLGIGIAALLYALWRSWPQPIEQSYSAPSTKISIVAGDLLEQNTHLVIGVCDTFDTATPQIISENSLQGQLLRRYYGGNVKELDERISQSLSSKFVAGPVEKDGKTQRYSLGTVATLNERGRCIFLLAYSEMDANNNARASADGLWAALSGLWVEVVKRGNGDPVSIPVIGGGLSRISHVLPAQDAIRFLILSFMLASRETRICEELRIVVQPEEYRKLDRLELQAFLSSLRPS